MSNFDWDKIENFFDEFDYWGSTGWLAAILNKEVNLDILIECVQKHSEGSLGSKLPDNLFIKEGVSMSQTKTKYTVTRIQTITVEIEAEDFAKMRSLHTEGVVDELCADIVGTDLMEEQYIYEVDGNVVDIWKEEEVSDE